MIKVPPKERWRKAWTPAQVKEITRIAETFKARGARSDLAAWWAAEEQCKSANNPYLGRLK